MLIQVLKLLIQQKETRGPEAGSWRQLASQEATALT